MELVDKDPYFYDLSKMDAQMPNVDLRSPERKEIDFNLGNEPITFGQQSNDLMSRKGASSFTISPAPNRTGFDRPFSTVSSAELAENKRYPLFQRDVDLEDAFARTQPWYKQLGNSVAKFGILTAGSFLQTFATLPNTIAAIKNRDFSELSGKDGYEAGIDTFVKNIEDVLPNYASKWEREHPFLSAIPFSGGAINFWGDKVFKNLGFTAGTIAGSLVQDAAIGAVTEGIGAVPLLASQIGRASLYLNKLFTNTNRVEEALNLARTLGKSEKFLAKVEDIGRVAEGVKVLNGIRYGTVLIGASRTESAVESRDAYFKTKEELTRVFRETNGREPVGRDLEEIESYATNAMNVRFGINMALLTVSNAVQFDNLFKSFTTAKGSVDQALKGSLEGVRLKSGSIDEFEKIAPSGRMSAIWEAAKPKVKNVFTEGVYEEGGQFAGEKGVYDYYTRKYKNLKDPNNAKVWNDLYESGQSLNFGLAKQFGSDEGLENMVVGGLVALISGAISGRIEKLKGVSTDDERLQASINLLNRYGVTGIFQDKFTSTANSVRIAQEMQDAAKNNNVFRYKNLKHDMFFSYVMSRIPSGMHDVTVAQLEMLKDLSKEEFEKTFGMNFDESSKKTVGEYVDSLINKANKINKFYSGLNATFRNPFRNIENPTSEEEKDENKRFDDFNNWKTNLAYYATISDDINDRLNNINQDIIGMGIHPSLDINTLSSVTNREELKALSASYEEMANNLADTITEFTSPADKRRTRNEIKKIRTLSERINLALSKQSLDLETFESLLNFELLGNEHLSSGQKVVPADKLIDLFNLGADVNSLNLYREDAQNTYDNLVSKSGFDKFFSDEEKLRNTTVVPEEGEADVIPSVEILNKEGKKESVKEGREYQITALSPAKVNKIADDRYELITPYGDSLFFSDRINADEAADEFNENLQDYNKVKVLAINPDGTLKIEDAAGNITNIDPRKLSGYELVETVEERMKKHKASLDKQLSDIYGGSGDIPTSFGTEDYKEPALKDAPIFYISTITESEGGEVNDWQPPIDSAPHVVRSRYFLNKIKFNPNRNRMRMIYVNHRNIDALKLNGIVQMSYNVDSSTKVEDIEYKGVPATDVSRGWMAAVFVEQDGTDASLYYVDQDGNRIGKVGEDTPSLGKIIFQTMPTIETKDSKGDPRYRGEQQKLLEAYSKAWEKYRQDFWAADPNQYQAFEFRISRGIPSRPLVPKLDEEGNPVFTEDGKQVMESDRNHVSDVLIPSSLISKTKGIIQISSTGTISHQGESINVPKGRPFFQYGDTFTFIRNSQFSKQQATNIYEVINAMANEMLAAQAAGKTPEINTRYSAYLSNILFWSNRSKPTTNQINFNTDTMQFELGGIKYGLSEIADKRMDIISRLQDTYISINKKTLDNKFFDKFYELYTVKNDDGTVTIEEREWVNYQTFLLSDKYPDGKARSIRETPMFTDIAKSSDGKMSFKQKYAVTIGVTLPVQIVPKAALPPSPPSTKTGPFVGEYSVNGKEENTIVLAEPLGETKFKALPGEGGFFNVEAVVSSAKELVNKKNEGDSVAVGQFDRLKKILIGAKDEEYVSRLTDEQIINAVASLVISNRLKVMNDQKNAPPPAPVVTPTPVSDKKTDIEAEKQKITSSEFKELVRLVKFFLENPKEPTVAGSVVGKYPALFKTITDIERRRQEAIEGIQTMEELGLEAPVGKEGFFYADAFGVDPEESDLDSFEGKTKQEVIDKINAKYDAELKALETPLAPATDDASTPPPTDPAPPPPPPTPPGGNYSAPPTDDYREVGAKDKKDRISEEDIAIFKNYVAEVAPNIPYEILENVIKINSTRRAWGVFENGVVKFVRGGLKGTEYHELGEAIWNGMLSKEEQDAIIADERAKGGTFTDRASRRKLEYATATRQQIKERIMDDFADYRVGKLPAKSLSERIRRFFKAIIDFLKSFGSNPSLKEQLFKDIDAGRFKKEVILPSVYNQAAEYRAVEGLTEVQTRDFVEDMTARVAIYLFGESKRLIFNPEKITGAEVFSKVIEQYRERVKPEDRLPEESLNELIRKTKEKLLTLGIVITDDAVDINTEEYNSKEYGGDPFKIDWKQTSPAAIRFILATLIKSKPSSIETIIANGGKLKADTDASSINGYRLINFSKAFGQILEKLSNTTSVQMAVDKVFELAKDDVNYISFLKRLGGDVSTLSAGKIATMKFDQFDEYDWRLFINFWQTFTKQKPDALIENISGSNVFTVSANFQSAKREVERTWIEKMKNMASDPDSIIKYSPARDVASGKQIGTYNVNATVLNSMPIRTIQDKIDYLSAIGVVFPMDAWQRLSDVPKRMNEASEKDKFDNAVSSLKTYFGANREIFSLASQTLQVGGPISILSELYAKSVNYETTGTFLGVDNTQVGSYSENNTPSLFENQFNESDTLDELKEKRPDLNDVYSKNSLVLKKGGLFYNEEGVSVREMKVGYIQGGRDRDAGKGLSGYKMSLGYRYTQEINQNINGRYFVLNQGDGSTPWLMNLGNNISFDDVSAGRAWSQLYTIFQGYLEDEVALALDWKNRERLVNVGEKKAKELRWFKEILSSKMVEEIERRIASGESLDTIMAYVKENISSFNEAVKSYIDKKTDKLKRKLINENSISFVEQDIYSFPMLDSDFATLKKINKHRITEKGIDNILLFVTMNYTIANTELHKILFGDPYQFKISEENGEIIFDELKRIKSFLSPARSMFQAEEYDNFLNNRYNKVLLGEGVSYAHNAKEVPLTEGTPGYHLHKPYTDTLTLTDDIIVSKLANSLPPAYSKVNVADGASWIMDSTYKEVLLKNGQWTDEAEAFHQWQMAYTRKAFAKKGIYTYPEDGVLKAHDESLTKKPVPDYKLHVLKPIVRGSKDGLNRIELVLDKFSQMPIYFSLVEGTELENTYIELFNSKRGYAVVKSGRKIGVDNTYDIYNPNGEFNKNPLNNNVRVPWSAYGIQVETSYQSDKQQIRGTQPTKLVSLDLFENGIPISDKALRAYRKNKELLDEMHENAYNELLIKLGIEDVGDGFVLTNGKALSEALVYEMFRRELSDNIKDSIQVDENGEFNFPLEASPSYTQIKNIVYSFIHKTVISVKVNGRPHVQAPVTGFAPLGSSRKLVQQIKDEQGNKKFVNISQKEYNALSEKDKKSVFLTDDTLKFYTKDAPYCEVMLPHWFKVKMGGRFKNEQDLLDYLNSTAEGREILRTVAFRIPTQSLSSMEVIRVKGFLPSYMGDTVIVPAEITTKAGSDFDIDKLNIYLKSTYIDRNGNIRLIKYFGSEAETKDFYAREFDKIVENKKIKKKELIDAMTVMFYDLKDSEGLVEKYADFLDVLLADVDDWTEAREKIWKDIDKLEDSKVQDALKEKWVKEMYKRSLENEYFKSMEELLTLPEVFERLVTPVDDAGLKEVSDRIIKLRGEEKQELSLLDRTYMTDMRHLYEMAKNWIGIVAVNITGLSLTQKVPTYIDPRRFSSLKKRDRDILGNGVMHLPHNTITKNDETYISLSGRKTADGTDQFISKRLSGYASGTVDVVKDPYLSKIIRSQLLVGPAMFLERVGAGQAGINFLNQPIIVEYVKMLDSKNIRSLFNSRNIQAIRDRFAFSDDGEIRQTPFNIATLEENIEAYYKEGKLSNSQLIEQQSILTEFLKYAKMAEQNFKFTQAINYDTTKFRSGEALTRKQFLTEKARTQNIICCVDNILQETFIGRQAYLLNSFRQAMGSVFKTEQDIYRFITENTLMKAYAEDEYLSNDDFERIANKIKASFIDYLILTKTNIGSEVERLMVDPVTSVASRLLDLAVKYPEVDILQRLVPISSNRMLGGKSVKLIVNDRSGEAENMNSGMMRELRDKNKELNDFYHDLVKLSILQGTYFSQSSIRNVVPVEDIQAIISPVIKGLNSTSGLEAFIEGSFHRNSFKDDDIVPRVLPKFFLSSDDPVDYQVDSYGEFYADIMQYYSSLFPNIKTLGIESTSRMILELSEKYNDADVVYDYLKVPRVVTDRKSGEMIDMKTGLTITKLSFVEMKEKGDPSLNDFFGYKKVKVNGEPLTYTNDKGDVIHVYKLVNLYGDSPYTVEHKEVFTKSVIDNATIKVETEIPDSSIVEYYLGKQKPLLQSSEGSTEPGSLAAGVVNIPDTELSVEKANQFIDLLQPQIQKQAYIENKAATANMMFSFGLRWARNIPNVGEKSEQGKNVGQPRPDRKRISSKEGVTYGYYTTDQNNKPLPPIKDLQPIIDFIQSKLGIDMSQYDAMLGNIYDEKSFIHQHRDTTESITAEGYPVIVLNLGADGRLVYDEDVKSTYPTFKETGDLKLSNGGIYAFGVGGENRFTFHHRIGSGLLSPNPLKPITLPGGQVLSNYRITLTFRRASDLEPGMPATPKRLQQMKVRGTQPTSGVEITKSNYTRENVQNNPDTAYVFTENTHSITAFPDRAGGGSAVIRGLDNAFAIVTKKKYDYNTRENVDYSDTPENFKEFVDVNTRLINELKTSGKSKIVFPQGFATDKAKMPTRFAEWLQKALLDNFGLVTELNSTKTGLISKSISQPTQAVSEQPTSPIIEEQEQSEKVSIFEARKNPLSYTTGQTKALLDIQNLIDKSTQGYYLLAGYAGTGKTTLVENIVKYAVLSGKTPVVMAPTNKAAVVLNSKLKENDTPEYATTVHKIIYGEPDPYTGDWIPKVPLKNSVIIVDESSMISKELMTDLVNSSKERNNIVIFMGDSFQLEQIGEDSGLFSSLKGSRKFLENYGMNLIGSTELTEVKRQSLDSNVLKMATLTREDGKGYIPSASIEDFSLSPGYGDFISSFRNAIAQGEDAIGIVATNSERMVMNQVARNAKFGNGEKATLIPSEKVMSVANSESFANGETFTIESIIGERSDLSTTITIESKDEAPKKYSMIAYEVVVAESGKKEIMFFFPLLDKPSIYHAQILNSIRENNPSLFDTLESYQYIRKNKKGVKKLSPTIIIGTYGYAVTGHKSQGSQWQKVFVNQNYTAPSWNSARWYYTAITRSSKEVIVLPQRANTRLSPSEINDKINKIVQPDDGSPLPSSSQQGAPSTPTPTVMTIGDFYESLSQEDKDKLGSMEDIMNEYMELPFDMSEQEFIDQLKCRL